jgi:hypothetical protein
LFSAKTAGSRNQNTAADRASAGAAQDHRVAMTGDIKKLGGIVKVDETFVGGKDKSSTE